MAESRGDFAAQLRSLRSAKGLSLRALAAAIGVSPVTVWKWENSNTNPRARFIAPLARALDVLPSQFELTVEDVSKPVVLAGTKFFESSPGGAPQPNHAMEKDGHSRQLEPLSDVIVRAKQMIAEVGGIDPGNITILITC